MKPQLLILPLVLFGSALPAFADRFVSGQSADVVLGQTSFTNGSSASLPNRFYNPYGVALDSTTGKVFVVDSLNNRVLRFSSAAAASNGANAEAVFGQPNFSFNQVNQGGAVAGSTLNSPYAAFVDTQGRLWISDFFNNRVLCFLNASFLGNNPPADAVLGQPSFTTAVAAVSQSAMDEPAGLQVDANDTLWVADFGNHRVLKFANVSSKLTTFPVGPPADGVLGQANFTANASAVGTAAGMNSPAAVATDSGGRLWVADFNNRRVLRFDNASSLANGATASGVLGQPDFVDTIPGFTAAKLSSPAGLHAAADGTLWIGEFSGKRVLGHFNAGSKVSGAAADVVLGQPDFTTLSSGVTADKTNQTAGVCSGPGDSLFVADLGNHRVLRFSPVKSPTLAIVTKPATTTRKKLTIRGTAAGSLTSVQYKVGSGAPKTANGTTSWSFSAPLKRGKNVITVYAVGPGGNSLTRSLVIRRK
jgi:sugar lactone lactonase YvrE